MLPFGIGFSEVLVVMVVILLVIGPNKLPDLAKTLGKGVRAARRAGNELKQAIQIEDDPYPQRPWMQQNVISDAESEFVDDQAWGCDGEGGVNPNVAPGLAGTVARTENAVLDDDSEAEADDPVATAGDADPETGDAESDEANRVDG